jgi:AmmeMemoRadiSam system protein A
MTGCDPTPQHQGWVLLQIARSSLEEALDRGVASVWDEAWLQQSVATFVTLTLDGMLRGCVGTVHASRPLVEDVRRNSVAAAFEDSRFPPLAAEELDRIEIEISLLSDLVLLEFESEEQAIAQLRPGVDGILLQHELHRATYLPQVWEQLPDPAQFLAQLKLKAGLAADFWSTALQLWSYTVTKFCERDYKA